MNNAVSQFRDAMHAVGLEPPETIEPGKLHRFPGVSKRKGNTAGWCKLFDDGLGGCFGDWAEGFTEHWQAAQDSTFTPADREAFRRQIAEAKAQAAAELEAKQEEAAKEAEDTWEAAQPITNHPYLVAKGVKPYGLRVHEGRLVVPMRSVGNLYSLQFIGADGVKRFLPGGRVKGCYFGIGKPNGVLCIAEGYATAATIHEATGHAVAVAFNAGNLEPVARALRQRFPNTQLVICADDDAANPNNPGVTKASEAAKAVGGVVVTPEFCGNRPENASDFNDLALLEGAEAVRRVMANALGSGAEPSDTPPSAGAPESDEVSSSDAFAEYEQSAVAHVSHTRAPRIVTLMEFLTMELPARELLLAPWLPRQGLAMIHAYRGIGKTHVALSVGHAVASGGSFLGWQAPKPAGVLLLDGEMPGPALQERLAVLVANSDRDVIAPFKMMTPDLQPKDRPSFNLSEAEDQEALQACLDGIELIIVDNLATLARTGKTNDAESWLPIQEWALKQRASGRSVLFIHHSGKSGAQRGTSAKEDVLDTVIGLRRPSDYETSQGARFEIHFEKARGFSGEDADPIEAALVTGPSGQMVWTAKPLEDALYERVIELFNEGLSQKEIAEEIQRDKSRVSRMVKRAKDEGRIRE